MQVLARCDAKKIMNAQIDYVYFFYIILAGRYFHDLALQLILNILKINFSS